MSKSIIRPGDIVRRDMPTEAKIAAEVREAMEALERLGLRLDLHVTINPHDSSMVDVETPEGVITAPWGVFVHSLPRVLDALIRELSFEHRLTRALRGQLRSVDGA